MSTLIDLIRKRRLESWRLPISQDVVPDTDEHRLGRADIADVLGEGRLGTACRALGEGT